jgi:hypothetical protein
MSVQAKHAEIEWARFRDTETYYALRDGPRLYRANWVIDTMARYLPDDHVALAQRLASTHARIHSSGGSSEIKERVQGGIGPASHHARTHKLARLIKAFAGFEAAALGMGRVPHGCLRGICMGDTQAELCRRVRYPESSRRSIRRLVQETMMAMQDHADRHPLDLCTGMEHQLAR